VQALFFNHLYDPISLVRDNEVKAAMCSLGVHCQSFNGDVLYEPWEVLAEGARPFTSFYTFWARWDTFIVASKALSNYLAIGGLLCHNTSHVLCLLCEAGICANALQARTSLTSCIPGS